MDVKLTCANCAFWDIENSVKVNGNKSWSECRKNAPMVVSEGSDVISCFPRSAGTDWCGEMNGRVLS